MFAGEKDSYNDDEDFLADQEGSGDLEGSGEQPTGKPSKSSTEQITVCNDHNRLSGSLSTISSTSLLSVNSHPKIKFSQES